MPIGVARLVALGTLLSACASHGARPPQSSQQPVDASNTAGTGNTADSSELASASPCPGDGGPQSRWREMTWAEYYLDVESQAWRRGARVIWIEPPRVSQAARAEQTCVR